MTGSGTWQYSTDGTTWNNFGAVTSTNALLITSTTQVRYQPNGQNGETATFTYRAWDQTSGTASTNSTAIYASTASNGGTTEFSSNTATASMVVSSVNDAPVLDIAGTMTLTTITEDQTSDSGQTIASVIASAGGDRITDVDTGVIEGIAITALTSGNGTCNTRSTAARHGPTSVSSQLQCLATAKHDLIRFVPNGQNGTSADFTFRAWDQTSGTAGTKVATAANDGTTAFSAAMETASIVVTDVNDAPVLDASRSPQVSAISEDAGLPWER